MDEIQLPKVNYPRVVNIIKALPIDHSDSLDSLRQFMATMDFESDSDPEVQEALQFLAYWISTTTNIPVDEEHLDQLTTVLSMFCFGLSLGQISAEG